MNLTTSQYEDSLNYVSTYSKPSQLRITDMRTATVVGAPMRCPLIKIYTNQGLVGYGEVRDAPMPWPSRAASWEKTPATSTRFSDASSSSGTMRAKRAASPVLNWPCGTWQAKPTGFPSTRC